MKGRLRRKKREGDPLPEFSSRKQFKPFIDYFKSGQIHLLHDRTIKLTFDSARDIKEFCTYYEIDPLRINKDNTCVLADEHVIAWLGKIEGTHFLNCCDLLAAPLDSDYSCIARVSKDTANLLAKMRHREDHQHLLSWLSYREKFDYLEQFIEKLSPETCRYLALTRHSAGFTFFEHMICCDDYTDAEHSFETQRQFSLCVSIFLSKLSNEACNQFALNQHDEGCSSFVTLIQYCDEDITQAFIERLTPETCNQVALAYDRIRSSSCYSDICLFTSQHIIEQFTAKLSPEVLYQALTRRKEGYDDFYRLSVLDELIAKWGLERALYFLNQSFDKAGYEENLLKHLNLHGMTIRDGGGSHDGWSVIARKMLENAVVMRKRKGEHDIHKAITSTNVPQMVKKSITSVTDQQGWRFSHFYGRSIILKNRKGDALVIKIQKKGKDETVTALSDGYKSTKFFADNKERLGLKSYIPTVVEFTSLEGVIEWVKTNGTNDPDKLQKFLDDAGANATTHAAFVYQVDSACKHYFTYLHDSTLSDEQFELANDTIVYDLFVLLRHGLVFNQLADIFHNLDHKEERDDKGRYIVLAELLRDMQRGGTGRLTGWLESVEYPNVRFTGLADLGDCISINNYIGSTAYTRQYYGDALDLHEEQSSNFLIGNVMAEYQYILFLNAGRRALAQDKEAKLRSVPKQDRFPIWLKHAKRVIRNCAYAISLTTHEPIADILVKMQSIVDCNVLARQMQFWMTNEYVKYINQDKLPASLYGADVPIKVERKRLRSKTFHARIGFSIDGKTPDLGPVNGQEPIKEANKLFYWMVTMIYQSYHNLSLAVKELHEVVQVKSVTQSEKLRQASFRYLPNKAYHKLQHALCEERLRSAQPLSSAMKNKLAQESEQHQRAAAALTIQGFWRRRQQAIKPVAKKTRVDASEISVRRLAK